MKKAILVFLTIVITTAISSQSIPNISELIDYNYRLMNTDDQVLLLDSGNVHFFMYSLEDSVIMGRSYYVFDNYGLLTKDSSIMLLPDTQEWIYSQKRLMQYNANHYLIDEILYEGDWLSPQWHEEEWRIFHYPQGDTLIMYDLINDWSEQTSSWQNYDSSFYIYNTDNLVEYEFSYGWDHNLNVYEKYYKYHHAYTNYLLTSDTSFSYWNGYEEYNGLTRYEYDGNGNRTKKESYYYDGTSGLTPSEKREYIYTGNNIYSKTIRYEWDTDISSWLRTEETHFYYNEDNNLDIVIYWELDDLGIMEKQWTYEFFYSYHTVVGNEEQKPIKSFSAFPNPCDDILTITSINSEELLLLDINGKIIRRLYINAGVGKLNLSNLEKAVYFLVSKNGAYQQKIIVH